jgi:hypothetical protein
MSSSDIIQGIAVNVKALAMRAFCFVCLAALIVRIKVTWEGERTGAFIGSPKA